jgi:hypothetical protein
MLRIYWNLFGIGYRSLCQEHWLITRQVQFFEFLACKRPTFHQAEISLTLEGLLLINTSFQKKINPCVNLGDEILFFVFGN